MLRWIFRRGAHTLTCELDARGRHTFEVSLVPHWNVSGGVVERFGDALSAMERHAAIARALRHAGWVVVAHASPEFVAAAA
jgi:hypothetical protein